MRYLFISAISVAFSLLCSAQIVRVSHTVAGATSGNTVTTSAISSTGANLGIACGAEAYNNYGGTVGTLTDSQGNTWIQMSNTGVAPYYGSIACFYSPLIHTGSDTVSYSGLAPVAVSIAFYSGVASGPDQQSASSLATGNGLSPVATGNLNPTNNDELIFSAMVGGTEILSSVSAVPLGIIDAVQFTSTNPYLADADQIQTTATAINPTWTSTAAGYTNMSAVSATFFSTLAPATLAITTAHLAEGFVSTVYSSASSIYGTCLVAVGGNIPYTWTITSGSLPTGLSINSVSGCITGTPTVPQSATNVTFKVTDNVSGTATVTLPLTVASTAIALTLGTCPNPITGTQYQAITSCTLSGAGGTAPLTYAQNVTNSAFTTLPAGISLGSSTGVISGTDYMAGSAASMGADILPPMDLLLTDSLGSFSHLSTLNVAMNGDYSWLAAANSCSGVFPCDSIFSSLVRLDSLPVDTSPAAAIPSYQATASIKIEPWMPFIKVPSSQSTETVTTGPGGYQIMFPPFTLTSAGYGSGTSYGPIPSYQPVEGSNLAACRPLSNSDCHTLGVWLNSDGTINGPWEQWESYLLPDGVSWDDLSNISWSQSEYTAETMPAQDVGSADAAGLPISAALVTYDQLMSGNAALIRFTLGSVLRVHVWPATAQVGVGTCTGGYEDVNHLVLQPGSPGGNAPTSCGSGYPPAMGEIFRINSATWTSPPNSCLTNASTNPQASRLFTAMRQHGLILADLGGNGYAIVAADARWDRTDLDCISNYLTLANLEPVNVQSLIKQLDGSNLPTVSYKTTATLPTSGVSMRGSVVLGGNVVIQ